MTNIHKEVLFVGAHPRLVGIIKLYHLATDDYDIFDRFQQMIAFDSYTLLNTEQLKKRKYSKIVITEDPVSDFADALRFAKTQGFADKDIITIAEPGRLHRLLVRMSPFQGKREIVKNIGYTLIRQNLIHRGHYGYCMILAAETALRMDLKSITAVEFGVWYGAGLLNLCELADLIEDTLGVYVKVFGFDTGAGLPVVQDYRDHPELWEDGSLAMPNFSELSQNLPERCELIIGDIKDTLNEFVTRPELRESPVGFVSIDVDQYRSTKSCLNLFSGSDDILQPVIPIWVDDSYLSVLQTTWAGEGLALREFNEENKLRKIEQKIVRTDDFPRLWHHCIYFAHIFDHPIRQGLKKARFDAFYHTDY